MYPTCFVEMSLLAMMRYAAYLSFETPSAVSGPFEQTGFRCAVLTVLLSLLVRVQTSVGELVGCFGHCQNDAYSSRLSQKG